MKQKFSKSKCYEDKFMEGAQSVDATQVQVSLMALERW
jgi:hypothetical protein